MVNINGQIEKLRAASTSLSSKVEELNASLLSTNDDAITNLKEELKLAVEALNNDIAALETDATEANKNKKW